MKLSQRITDVRLDRNLQTIRLLFSFKKTIVKLLNIARYLSVDEKNASYVLNICKRWKGPLQEKCLCNRECER